jgi:hypothetical protein
MTGEKSSAFVSYTRFETFHRFSCEAEKALHGAHKPRFATHQHYALAFLILNHAVHFINVMR